MVDERNTKKEKRVILWTEHGVICCCCFVFVVDAMIMDSTTMI